MLSLDTYGHLVPGANKQAVGRLDDAADGTARNPGATIMGGQPTNVREHTRLLSEAAILPEGSDPEEGSTVRPTLDAKRRSGGHGQSERVALKVIFPFDALYVGVTPHW
jgi:hypothetical protein